MAVAAYLNPGAELGTAVELARTAERLGYDSVWVTHGLGRDSFLVLAAYGAATSRIGLGNGVVPIYPRHPVAMAQEALTLNELTANRFRLGIGVSHAASMQDMLGLRIVEPLAAMREYVTVLRGALGEGTDFTGRHYRARWAMAVPKRPAAPPIYLAALSAKMLELAGEIADGVLLNWIPPEAVPASIERLSAGAGKAGRTLDGFEIASFVRTCVTDDAAAARETLARDVTGYATVDVYASFFRTAGYADEVAAVGAAWSAGDRSGAVARISPRMLDGLGVVGDEAFCRTRIAEFAASGLTQPVIVPFAPPGADRGALLRTLRTFP